MKKFLAFILLVSCVVFAPLNFSDHSAEAAGKTMYVNAKGDIILRETPAKDGVRIGTIKNRSAITVLSSSKGWSKVDTGKKTGYVYTSALSAKKPVPPVVKSGLMPKVGLVLTYYPSISGSSDKETFDVTQKDGMRLLVNRATDGDDLVYSEADGRFTLGYDGLGYNRFSFAYPMKHSGKTTEFFEEVMEDQHYLYSKSVTVESTVGTLKTPAGTFNDVVVIQAFSGYKHYFAKGYGLIKIVMDNGETLVELHAVK